MKGKIVRRTLGLVLSAVILAAALYAAYVFLSYHRIGDRTLDVAHSYLAGADAQAQPQYGAPETDTVYRVASANIGFGAYSADYSFFMDGGKESRARSADAVRENVTGEAALLAQLAPELLLLQEVDTDGTRSHHVDETAYIVRAMAGCEVDEVFAQNYDSPYLLYPLTAPHGANRSGILTLSRFPVSSAVRRELPVESGFMKLLDLDRCYSVSRIPTANGRELVLYNLHLSAYTTDGAIATEQLRLLCANMLAEYEAGNYCVAGGDFNKDLLGSSPEIFGIAAGEGDTWAQPIPEGTIPAGLTLVAPFDADAPVASCRTASEPYSRETTFRLTVDGFLVSGNIEVADSAVLDAGFLYSDHNPVWMDFKLK